MFISKRYSSPHFENKLIPVEFVILHYTAQSLTESLKILSDLNSTKPASCHLLIDEQGGLYELVDCWEGSCKKAFHAGSSRFVDVQGKRWENFNSFSLGIELVSWNGNIFHFTESQYKSLFEVLSCLKNLYPSLQNPERILGHEHIAGFRGKKDPGCFFDWEQLFKSVYPDQFASHSNSFPIPKRSSILTKKQRQSLVFLTDSLKWDDQKARQISLIMEKPFLPFCLKKLYFSFLMR